MTKHVSPGTMSVPLRDFSLAHEEHSKLNPKLGSWGSLLNGYFATNPVEPNLKVKGRFIQG